MWSSIAAALLLLGPEAVPLELRFTAPLGCPDRAEVWAELRRLGPAPAHPTTVVGSVVASTHGYTLQLRIETADRVEERSVEAQDCAVLSSTAALLVAVTVDAVGTSARIAELEEAAAEPPTVPLPSPPSEAAVPVAPIPVPRPPASTASPPAPRAPRRHWKHGAELGVSAGPGLGWVPRFTGGLDGDVGWRHGPLRLRAMGWHWFGRSTSVGPDAAVFAQLSGASLRICHAFERPRFEVPTCIGPDLGVLRGEGRGSAVVSNRTADLWVGASVSQGIVVWLTNPDRSTALGLRLRATLAVALRQPALHLDRTEGPQQAFRALPAAFGLGLGPMVRFR